MFSFEKEILIRAIYGTKLKRKSKTSTAIFTDIRAIETKSVFLNKSDTFENKENINNL